MKDARPLYAVILAGGSGTRFWPLSRKLRPKQLLPLVPSAQRQPMVALTLERIGSIVPPEQVFLVAPQEQKELLLEAARVPPSQVLVEPRPANTSPAVLLGTLAAAARHPEAVVAILPSDHAIEPAEELCAALSRSAELAAKHDAIVTFGIRPEFPTTGYGYVERGKELSGEESVWEVESFREKPDAETAKSYVDSGRFYWNSGMFVFTASRLMAAYRRLYPSCAEAMQALYEELGRGGEPRETLALLYDSLEPTSIDYAIMEKEQGLLVLEVGFSWNDVGAPSALTGLWPKDVDGNCIARGRSVAIDARDNMAILEDPKKVLALIGVEDLVVIDTAEALLICPKDRDQEIRRMVELVASRGMEELL